MNTVTVAICTGMRQDLTQLMASIVRTDCQEILVIGTQGISFPPNEHFQDPRVRLLYVEHALSIKRNAAIREARGDIIAFIDDDAVASPTWMEALRRGFSSDQVGIVTGPSLLPSTANLWWRTAQLALGSSPYSRRRYNCYQEGEVEWFNVIGANFAFRRKALHDAGGCPEEFLAQGDDMAMSHNVVCSGWRVFYSPDACVYHPPHAFCRQLVQIYRFGRAAKRLKRAGIVHPKRDPAYYLYIPVLVLFSLFYISGEIVESIIFNYDVKAKVYLKRRFKRGRIET